MTGFSSVRQVSCPSKFLRRMWVEQPALGVDDETDYVEEVFDPGDYDDVDDAL